MTGLVRIGPEHLTVAAISLYTAPSGGAILRVVRLVNDDQPNNHNFSLYLSASAGATAAGTELYLAKVVMPDLTDGIGLGIPLNSGDVLVAVADEDNKLTFTGAVWEL